MALDDDIAADVVTIFQESFTVSEGWAIPRLNDISFDNQGKKIRLVALFVDIRKSTAIVEALGLQRAARMYKAYLRGVTKIVNARGGQILSFNGDGIVAGFVGAKAANAAVLSGLNINWFNSNVLKPKVHTALDAVKAPTELMFDHGIGVDVGDVLIIKGGMRGNDNSDLVWAGNAVNYAVKVGSNAGHPYNLYISEEVMKDVQFSLKLVEEGTFIWDTWHWKDKNRLLWRTSWWFAPNYISAVPDPPLPSPRRRSIFDPAPKPTVRPSLLEALSRNTKPLLPTSLDAMFPAKPREPTMNDFLADLFDKKKSR